MRLIGGRKRNGAAFVVVGIEVSGCNRCHAACLPVGIELGAGDSRQLKTCDPRADLRAEQAFIKEAEGGQFTHFAEADIKRHASADMRPKEKFRFQGALVLNLLAYCGDVEIGINAGQVLGCRIDDQRITGRVTRKPNVEGSFAFAFLIAASVNAMGATIL